MLMDMFYSATEGIVRHRRRYHFHEVRFLCYFPESVFYCLYPFNPSLGMKGIDCFTCLTFDEDD